MKIAYFSGKKSSVLEFFEKISEFAVIKNLFSVLIGKNESFTPYFCLKKGGIFFGIQSNFFEKYGAYNLTYGILQIWQKSIPNR